MAADASIHPGAERQRSAALHASWRTRLRGDFDSHCAGPTPAGTHPNLADDDNTTGLIEIGFDFKFFGTTYNKINIATNGIVGFDAEMGNGCCNGEPIPRNDFQANTIIAGLWSDLTPDATGQIWYGVAGVENATGTDAYFVPGRVAANFELVDDAVQFTPPLDNTPPVIAANVTGTIGNNGWYRPMPSSRGP